MRLVDLILLYTENKSDATSNFTWCCPTGVLVAWVVIGFLQRFRNLCHPSRLTHHQCSGRMTKKAWHQKNIQHWVTSAETDCCSMKSNFSVSFLGKDVHKDESQERWHTRLSLIWDCLYPSWSPYEPIKLIIEVKPYLNVCLSWKPLSPPLTSIPVWCPCLFDHDQWPCLFDHVLFNFCLFKPFLKAPISSLDLDTRLVS